MGDTGEFVLVGWIDLDHIHRFHPVDCGCSIGHLIHIEANEVYGKKAAHIGSNKQDYDG